jgi:hypothetical protein
MTYHEGDDTSTRRDRPSGITDRMLWAGKEQFASYDPRAEFSEDCVVRIYQAMEEERLAEKAAQRGKPVAKRSR